MSTSTSPSTLPLLLLRSMVLIADTASGSSHAACTPAAPPSRSEIERKLSFRSNAGPPRGVLESPKKPKVCLFDRVAVHEQRMPCKSTGKGDHIIWPHKLTSRDKHRRVTPCLETTLIRPRSHLPLIPTSYHQHTRRRLSPLLEGRLLAA